MTNEIECAGRCEVKKIDQTETGADNPRGNCLQAALATVMGRALADTIDVTAPHIDPDMWHLELSDWGETNGFQIASQRELPDEEYCVAIGPTVRKNGLHATVYRNGELWHDPHPSRDGLTRVRYYLAVKGSSRAA